MSEKNSLTVKELVDYYKSVMINLIKDGKSVSQAHEEAKNQLDEIINTDNVNYMNDLPELWGKIGAAKKKLLSEYKRNSLPSRKKRKKDKETTNEFGLSFQRNGFSWMDIMRAMADSGFVPYEKHIYCLLPNIKAHYWSTWIANLHKEGYEFENGEFGYKTIKFPIDSEKEEIALQIKSLLDELNNLKNKMANLERKRK